MKEISDAEMQKIEEHIWSHVDDQSYSRKAKATLIWLLRQTENLTLPVRLFTRYDREKIASQIDAMNSRTRKMQIGDVIKASGSNFLISIAMPSYPLGSSMVVISPGMYDKSAKKIDLNKTITLEIEKIMAENV